MVIFLAVINSLFSPYWDTLKKHLAENNISPLTIIHAPNIVGHPIGIIALIVLGVFAIPRDLQFFLLWFIMIGFAAVSLSLNILGLLKTKFFGVQVVSRLGFIASSLAAIVVVGEHLRMTQISALLIATLGIILFLWPKRISSSNVKWDKGILLIIISLFLSGFAAGFYKLASFHVSDYMTFLSGRFIGDMIGWSLVWILGLYTIKRNPFSDFAKCISDRSGLKMTIGMAASSLVVSFLIFKLPLVTYALLTTLTVPSSYLFSHFKYNERLTLRMLIGTILIIGSIGIFLL